MSSFINDRALSALHSFPGTHFFNTSVFSPAYDHVPRNITAWLSPKLTIGAESFDENVVGGPNVNQEQCNPAVVQWLRGDGSAGFISLYAETEALDAEVMAGSLKLSYPDGNCSSEFTLFAAPDPLHCEQGYLFMAGCCWH